MFHNINREQLIQPSAHLTTLSQRRRYLPLSEPLMFVDVRGLFLPRTQLPALVLIPTGGLLDATARRSIVNYPLSPYLFCSFYLGFRPAFLHVVPHLDWCSLLFHRWEPHPAELFPFVVDVQ